MNLKFSASGGGGGGGATTNGFQIRESGPRLRADESSTRKVF